MAIPFDQSFPVKKIQGRAVSFRIAWHISITTEVQNKSNFHKVKCSLRVVLGIKCIYNCTNGQDDYLYSLIYKF